MMPRLAFKEAYFIKRGLVPADVYKIYIHHDKGDGYMHKDARPAADFLVIERVYHPATLEFKDLEYERFYMERSWRLTKTGGLHKVSVRRIQRTLHDKLYFV